MRIAAFVLALVAVVLFVYTSLEGDVALDEWAESEIARDERDEESSPRRKPGTTVETETAAPQASDPPAEDDATSTFRGKVVEKTTLTPVPGAAVRVEAETFQRHLDASDLFEAEDVYGSTPVTRADDQGLFSVTMKRGSSVVLVVHRRGYAPAVIGPVMVQRQPPGESLMIELAPGRSVEGMVVNEAGDPIANASVLAGNADNVQRLTTWTGRALRRTTDDNGTFRLEDIAVEGHLIIAASAEGYATSFVSAKIEGGRVRILLRRGFIMRGRVFDDMTASAVADVPVIYRNLEGVVMRTRTDASGTYEFRDTPREKEFFLSTKVPNRVMRFRLRRGAIKRAFRYDLRALPEAGTTHIEDLHVHEGGAVAGRVRDEAGAGIADVRLTLMPRDLGIRTADDEWHTTSRDDGTFVFEHVPEMTFLIFARHDDFVMKTEPVLESSMWGGRPAKDGPAVTRGRTMEDQEVAMIVAGRVEGVVLDAEGKPVADARVYPRLARPPAPGTQPAIATTDADGRFILTGLPREKMGIRAFKWNTDILVDAEVDLTHEARTTVEMRR